LFALAPRGRNDRAARQHDTRIGSRLTIAAAMNYARARISSSARASAHARRNRTVGRVDAAAGGRLVVNFDAIQND